MYVTRVGQGQGWHACELVERQGLRMYDKSGQTCQVRGCTHGPVALYSRTAKRSHSAISIRADALRVVELAVVRSTLAPNLHDGAQGTGNAGGDLLRRAAAWAPSQLPSSRRVFRGSQHANMRVSTAQLSHLHRSASLPMPPQAIAVLQGILTTLSTANNSRQPLTPSALAYPYPPRQTGLPC